MTTGAFAKIAQANPTEGGNIIRDGNYKLLIEKVFINNGYNGEAFIAELRVIEASPNGAVDEQGRPVVPNAVGSTASLVCMFKQGDIAYNNAKKLILAATAGLGYTEDQITPEVMAQLCSEQNPLRGVAVIDETYRTVNQGRNNPANRGKQLTVNKWKPIPQSQDMVLQQRQWLDSNAAKADMGAPPAQPAAQQAAPQQQVAAPPAQQQTAPAGVTKPLGGILGGILGGGK